jgi:hypothetical protein
MIDIPPPPPNIPVAIQHECVISAAAYYNLPPELVIVIRQQEAGTVGKESGNKNGSKDVGPMQVNTIHLSTFKLHGISRDQLRNNECVNLFAGAFILHQSLARAGKDTWKGIGNYHSATPTYHWKYRRQVSNRLISLQKKFPDYIQWLRDQTQRLRAAYIKDGIIPTKSDS